MQMPTIQAVLDADSLGDWLYENAQTDMVAASVGVDAQERPFAAWIRLDMYPKVDAMAALAETSDDERPAYELLTFPVYMLKTGGE